MADGRKRLSHSEHWDRSWAGFLDLYNTSALAKKRQKELDSLNADIVSSPPSNPSSSRASPSPPPPPARRRCLVPKADPEWDERARAKASERRRRVLRKNLNQEKKRAVERVAQLQRHPPINSSPPRPPPREPRAPPRPRNLWPDAVRIEVEQTQQCSAESDLVIPEDEPPQRSPELIVDDATDPSESQTSHASDATLGIIEESQSSTSTAPSLRDWSSLSRESGGDPAPPPPKKRLSCSDELERACVLRPEKQRPVRLPKDGYANRLRNLLRQQRADLSVWRYRVKFGGEQTAGREPVCVRLLEEVGEDGLVVCKAETTGAASSRFLVVVFRAGIWRSYALKCGKLVKIFPPYSQLASATLQFPVIIGAAFLQVTN